MKNWQNRGMRYKGNPDVVAIGLAICGLYLATNYTLSKTRGQV